MAGRVREPDELAEDLDEIKAQLAALMAELKTGYVPRELYEARHTALRSEIALEFAAMKTQNATTRTISDGARTLALWCLGILATAVVVALVGFVATGGNG